MSIILHFGVKVNRTNFSNGKRKTTKKRIFLFSERSTFLFFFFSFRFHSWRKMAATNKGRVTWKVINTKRDKKGPVRDTGGLLCSGFHAFAEEETEGCELIRIDSRNEWKGHANVEKDETQTFQPPPPCTISSPRPLILAYPFIVHALHEWVPWNRGGFWPLEKIVPSLLSLSPPLTRIKYHSRPSILCSELSRMRRGPRMNAVHSGGVGRRHRLEFDQWETVLLLFFFFFNGCKKVPFRRIGDVCFERSSVHELFRARVFVGFNDE